MAKVMISSTGRDLAAYRKVAIDTCLRLGMQPIAMELFEAMGAGATAGSKKKVEEADVYVGIIAFRSGYIEAGYDQPVTEIEFDYAGARGLDRLCFLSDPAYPWPPESIDLNRQQVEAFRHRVEASLIRAIFTTVDDFARKLLHALVEWRDQNRPALSDEGLSPGQAAMSTVPSQPPLLVGRADDLASLKRRLGAGGGSGHPSPLTIMRGWPGVGKTTLLKALVHESDVLARFRDGVLWASVGASPDAVRELSRWARALGDAAIDSSPGIRVGDLMRRVRALLAGRAALLVVDDVWRAEDAGPFLLGGPKCATVLTTRLPAVATQLTVTSEDVYVLGQLTTELGVELLRRLAPKAATLFPSESEHLVEELEGLPLGIRIAARLLETEVALAWGVDDLVRGLVEGRKLLAAAAPSDRFAEDTGTLPTLAEVLRMSTDRLEPQTAERFALLGAMAAKPATFDLAAMQAIWLVDDARPTARALVDRGLLEFDLDTGRFQMHAVLAMHARSMLGSE